MIQQWWSAILVARAEKDRIAASEMAAAIIIQTRFRGFAARRQFTKTKDACGVIQQWWSAILVARAEKDRIKAVNLERNNAASIIHRAFLCYGAKMQLAYRRVAVAAACAELEVKFQENAARIIQQSFRAYRVRRQHVMARCAAARTIERAYCAHRSRQTERLKIQNCAAICIQALARGWLARKNSSFSEWKQRHMQALQTRAVLRIQTAYRGYRTRKAASAVVKKMLERVEKANAFAAANPEMTIANRTKSALQILLTHKKLTFVLRAVESLAVATVHSTGSCNRLANAGVVPVLIALIQSCNRSAPQVMILHHALTIFLNVTKCPETKDALFENKDAVGMIAQVLQMHRDKEQVVDVASKLLLEFCKDMGKVATIKADKASVLKFATILKIIMAKSKLAPKAASVRTATKASKAPKASKATVAETPVQQLKRFVDMVKH